MRLRQIALVAHDLEQAASDLTEVLGLSVGFRDPAVAKYGLVNVVIPVGDTFLEVVSPAQAGTTAGRLLEKRGGDGGYMVILQVPDIHAARARPAALGVRVVAEYSRPDGVYMTHLHPRDVGGAILSIDAMEPPERWEWGGPDWKAHVRTEDCLSISGVTVQAETHEAAAKMAARWAEVLGVPAEAVAGGFVQRLSQGGTIRFEAATDGRGEGVSTIELTVRDPQRILARAQARGRVDAQGRLMLCGTRVDLVAA
jgi:catechol 2,3-dioxygenase-like lactoylglutathione lyase family enzyme